MNKEFTISFPEVPLWALIATPIVLWYVIIIILCRLGFFQNMLFTVESMFGSSSRRPQIECGMMFIFSPIVIPVMLIVNAICAIGRFCSKRSENK